MKTPLTGRSQKKDKVQMYKTFMPHFLYQKGSLCKNVKTLVYSYIHTTGSNLLNGTRVARFEGWNANTEK